MDYATKELTESLQQIVARETSDGNEHVQPAADRSHNYCSNKLTLPKGVDRFLKTRRDFYEKTRDVSIGSY